MAFHDEGGNNENMEACENCPPRNLKEVTIWGKRNIQIQRNVNVPSNYYATTPSSIMASTLMFSAVTAEVPPVAALIFCTGATYAVAMYYSELLRERFVYSKGGKKNVWPDGQYDKPNPNGIDWRKGDQELADIITGLKAPKGPGLIKKWFRDKRP